MNQFGEKRRLSKTKEKKGTRKKSMYTEIKRTSKWGETKIRDQ